MTRLLQWYVSSNIEVRMPQFNKILRHVRKWSNVAMFIFRKRAYKILWIFYLEINTARLKAVWIWHSNANVSNLIVADSKRAIYIYACRSANARKRTVLFKNTFHELKLFRVVSKNFNSRDGKLSAGQLFTQFLCFFDNMLDGCVKLLFGSYRTKYVKLVHATDYILVFENTCRGRHKGFEPRQQIRKLDQNKKASKIESLLICNNALAGDEV